MLNQPIQYSVIVPLYNEELVLRVTYVRLKKVMESIGETYEIVLVDDGSRDGTLEIARDICRQDGTVKLLSFSRNFGHQVAITAGMDHASGKAVIVIDADLQDPPEVIPAMVEKWKEGYEVVYGKRVKRMGETFFKKASAKAFYRTLRGLTEVDVPVDAGDFRLIDRKVCDTLKAIPEHNRYVRGLVSWIGFKQTGVEFVREERFAGETKYPLKKMIRFASDAITSFSCKPLRLATYLGTTVSILGILGLLLLLANRLFSGNPLPGWLWLVPINLLFNGLIFVVLGVIGEYIARIYDEAKGRPLYIIGEKEGF